MTLTNRSGTDFENACTGPGGRTGEPGFGLGAARSVPNTPCGRVHATAADAAPPPQRESLGDYHLYTIQQPLNLLDQQTKQLALLSASDCFR